MNQENLQGIRNILRAKEIAEYLEASLKDVRIIIETGSKLEPWLFPYGKESDVICYSGIGWDDSLENIKNFYINVLGYEENK